MSIYKNEKFEINFFFHSFGYTEAWFIQTKKLLAKRLKIRCATVGMDWRHLTRFLFGFQFFILLNSIFKLRRATGTVWWF